MGEQMGSPKALTPEELNKIQVENLTEEQIAKDKEREEVFEAGFEKGKLSAKGEKDDVSVSGQSNKISKIGELAKGAAEVASDLIEKSSNENEESKIELENTLAKVIDHKKCDEKDLENLLKNYKKLRRIPFGREVIWDIIRLRIKQNKETYGATLPEIYKERSLDEKFIGGSYNEMDKMGENDMEKYLFYLGEELKHEMLFSSGEQLSKAIVKIINEKDKSGKL